VASQLVEVVECVEEVPIDGANRVCRECEVFLDFASRANIVIYPELDFC
jgi:hypothetical protein